MKKMIIGTLIITAMFGMAFANGQGEDSGSAGYPKKTIEFLVPAPAGAIIDNTTRPVADMIDLGVSTVVINRPGASQTVGTAEASVRPGDGYTVLTAAPGGMLLQPHFIDLTYSLDDFRHLTALVPPESQMVVTGADSPFQTWEELEAMIKSGKEVTWSTANPNGIGFLAWSALASQAGFESAQFVPFTGSAEGIAAMLGGHIDFYVIDTSVAKVRIKDGQFTGLLNLDAERRDDVSQVPAAGEFGYEDIEAFKGVIWFAVRKDTPDEAVSVLKEAFDSAVADESFINQLNNIGFNAPGVYTEQELTDLLKSAYEAFGSVVNELGIGK